MIRVLGGGALTTVQDLGREGYQRYGVPVAGAMDHRSLRVANLLAGNEEGAAALEITLLGPTLAFDEETVIALAGADLAPLVNGADAPMYRALCVRAGDVLSFGAPRTGCRAYVAFAGGLDVPLVMGSRSTHTKSQMGGYQGRRLQKGDALSLLPRKALLSLTGRHAEPEDFSGAERTLRVLPGPQDDRFTEAGKRTFLSESYVVTDKSDRMGCRMSGPKIEHTRGADIISDGICFGAVQVPSEGSPIIMLADRQTTGGYAKIAHVISADLTLAAQLKPGDRVRFQAVTIEAAQDARVQALQALAALKARLDAGPRLVPYTHRDFKVTVNGTRYEVGIDELAD